MAGPKKKSEIIAREWTTLESLWNGCKASVTDKDVREEIDVLFQKQKGPIWSSEEEDWHALNLAEQRVGAHLEPTQLSVEYESLLGIARDRKIASLPTHEENKKLFSTPPPAGVSLERQRAVYLSLLYVLQSGFVESRFRRRLRRETATRLFGLGLSLIVLTLGISLVDFRWCQSGLVRVPGLGLLMVATFGVLGLSHPLIFHTTANV
jgi:hypothetical protein